MKNDVLTDTFVNSLKPVEVVMFPKPLKKPKRTMKDYAERAKKQRYNAHRIEVKGKPTLTLVKQKIIYKKIKKVAGKNSNYIIVPKEKTRWQLIKILDGMVSNFILNKKCMGLCMRCGKRHLAYENKKGEMKCNNYGCSHYWPRDYMGTRFEEENLDGLCWLPCHSQKWEKSKQGDYKDYMIKKLGVRGYNKLELKARTVTKFSRQNIQLLINNFDKIWK